MNYYKTNLLWLLYNSSQLIHFTLCVEGFSCNAGYVICRQVSQSYIICGSFGGFSISFLIVLLASS